jgi:F420-dependent methylenetetrahydromethanopterin dehydrogenase
LKNRWPLFISPRGRIVETDTLNALVSGAIWRAEQLETHGIPSAPQAWAEVSSLEEELAVRAALKAGDYTRAQALADGYLSEDVAPKSLKTALCKILEEDTQAMASRFQYASKHHSLREAQGLARRFREAGAFGLAA